MKVSIIIPARFKSTRFPGKPLTLLKGRPAIIWTLEAASAVKGIDSVHVATDNEAIAAAVTAYGGDVVMTSEKCRNGTERVAEAARRIGLQPDDIVVNLQGDAPLTPPSFVENVVDTLKGKSEAEMVTPVLNCDPESYARFVDDRRKGNVGATTVVFDNRMRALYFSKELIPFVPKSGCGNECPVFHHVGIYAYRTPVLKRYVEWPIGRLEHNEQLEQLRFLENGATVVVSVVEAHGQEFWELNNPGDVAVIENMMASNASRLGR
jgi:3-deoxy-manno-octulosonate cytidylyltransferase (CMP-KDO synthetase)